MKKFNVRDRVIINTKEYGKLRANSCTAIIQYYQKNWLGQKKDAYLLQILDKSSLNSNYEYEGQKLYISPWFFFEDELKLVNKNRRIIK